MGKKHQNRHVTTPNYSKWPWMFYQNQGISTGSFASITAMTRSLIDFIIKSIKNIKNVLQI